MLRDFPEATPDCKLQMLYCLVELPSAHLNELNGHILGVFDHIASEQEEGNHWVPCFAELIADYLPCNLVPNENSFFRSKMNALIEGLMEHAKSTISNETEQCAVDIDSLPFENQFLVASEHPCPIKAETGMFVLDKSGLPSLAPPLRKIVTIPNRNHNNENNNVNSSGSTTTRNVSKPQTVPAKSLNLSMMGLSGVKSKRRNIAEVNGEDDDNDNENDKVPPPLYDEGFDDDFSSSDSDGSPLIKRKKPMLNTTIKEAKSEPKKQQKEDKYSVEDQYNVDDFSDDDDDDENVDGVEESKIPEVKEENIVKTERESSSTRHRRSSSRNKSPHSPSKRSQRKRRMSVTEVDEESESDDDRHSRRRQRSPLRKRRRISSDTLSFAPSRDGLDFSQYGLPIPIDILRKNFFFKLLKTKSEHLPDSRALMKFMKVASDVVANNNKIQDDKSKWISVFTASGLQRLLRLLVDSKQEKLNTTALVPVAVIPIVDKNKHLKCACVIIRPSGVIDIEMKYTISMEELKRTKSASSFVEIEM
eukprot:TRINITY_DN1346_c0_g2_i1.p1 TRINITY_DN1346_c0_g2~~TRINITY_DN1346_c0_g2_i1.p1  ORF type:complete len:533 (-),score=163.27 TRINITY_DN1346_c0_g2_i1:35-1633(-)